MGVARIVENGRGVGARITRARKFRNRKSSPLIKSRSLLTLGAHAQEGYGTCLVCVCVCVSVCYHSSGNIGRFYAENEVRRGLS